MGQDAGHVPGPLIALSLDALKVRYSWIKTYEATPSAAGYEIDRKSITHVLERHHPDYWIGEVKATQSFLPRSMTPADIADVIQDVFAQNREEIL